MALINVSAMRALRIALYGACLAASPMAGASGAPSRAPAFHPDVFSAVLHQRFDGKVVGFEAALGDENGIRAKVSNGKAQKEGDGNVPMKTYVYANIGSVSKMLSGIALLNLFDKHKLEAPGHPLTVQQQLDLDIYHKLPSRWRRLLPPLNKKITYRRLLQHKSDVPETALVILYIDTQSSPRHTLSTEKQVLIFSKCLEC
jgi:CubicO group peptidase (beta-lactamase class C family)